MPENASVYRRHEMLEKTKGEHAYDRRWITCVTLTRLPNLGGFLYANLPYRSQPTTNREAGQQTPINA